MSGAGYEEVVARNRERQVMWYGEPLGDRFRRLLARVELSQAELAGVLGLSAPMLSQLMSGHRARISNPAVLARLAQLERLAADPRFGQWTPQERQARLAEVRAANPTVSSLEAWRPAPAPPADAVAAVRALLHAAATPEALADAAGRLQAGHPTLAELLRVYGTGDLADARAHYTRLLGSGPSAAGAPADVRAGMPRDRQN